MIVSQVDAANNLFPSDVKNTMIYNEDDDTANPFMSLGTLNWTDYMDDEGYFEFQVEWTGGEVDSSSLIWKQSSIPTETSGVTGFEKVEGVDDVYDDNTCYGFEGVSTSTYSECVIDGSADCWWSCMAVVSCHTPDCIPAINGLTATDVKLYIWNPGSQSTDGKTVK